MNDYINNSLRNIRSNHNGITERIRKEVINIKDMKTPSCDICGSTANVKAGKYYFYCEKHEETALNKLLRKIAIPFTQAKRNIYVTE